MRTAAAARGAAGGATGDVAMVSSMVKGLGGSELGFRVRDGRSPHRQKLAVGGGGSTKRGGQGIAKGSGEAPRRQLTWARVQLAARRWSVLH